MAARRKQAPDTSIIMVNKMAVMPDAHLPVIPNHDQQVLDILLRIVDAMHEQTRQMQPWKSIREEIEQLHG